VHVVPNGVIDKVKNMTKEYSFYLFDVSVAYREDVDEVMRVLHEIAEELRRDPQFAGDILEPLEMLGVDQFADSAVIIKCRIKTQPIKQWRVGREMNRWIKKTFDAKGIEIPFPHQTIYWGEPKQGTPPPLYVAGLPQTQPTSN
jgi:small conductance mechanosensitive channel